MQRIITDAYLKKFPDKFEALHKYPDFRAFYEAAIEVSGLRNNRHLHERQLRVLDAGGNTGIIGKMLKKEFEGRVDYTNLEMRYRGHGDDNTFRKKFGLRLTTLPPDVLPGDIKDLDALVKDGTAYDAMFVLNFNPPFRKGEHFPDRSSHEKEFLFAYAMQIHSLYSALVFAQAALHLVPGGKLVEGSLFQDDALEARLGFFRSMGFNFSHEGYSSVPLSLDASSAFARHDLRQEIIEKRWSFERFHDPLGKIESQVELLAELYKHSFGIHVFTALENDRKHVKSAIEELRDKWQNALGNWGDQDRFCG